MSSPADGRLGPQTEPIQTHNLNVPLGCLTEIGDRILDCLTLG